MRELLAGLVPGPARGRRAAIVERAEGIPLYAVETVRMLLAEKRLVQDGDRYRPVGDLSTIAVPETLTALIAARLDALEPADRSLVLDAAVLGQRFTVDAPRRPRGAGTGRPRAAPPGARPARAAQPRGGPAVARARPVRVRPGAHPRGRLQHAREAGPQGTASCRRPVFRDRSGPTSSRARSRSTTSLRTRTHAEGPEADALATQARLALRGAAERAVALASNDQAISLLRQALTVATGPADRADLLERLGLAADVVGSYRDAYAAFEEAAALLRALDDRHALVRVLRETGTQLVNAKRLDEALALLEGSVVEFADLGDDPDVLATHGALARCYFLSDRFADAVRATDEILGPVEHGEHFAILADVLITKGSALVSLGRMVEGVGLVIAGGRLAEEHGLNATRFRALNNQSVLTVEVDPARSYAVAMEGLDLARRVGATGWVNNFVGNMTYLAVRRGDWAFVEREATARLDEHPEAGDRVLILSNLAAPRIFRGTPVDDLERDLLGMVDLLPEHQIEPTRSDVAGMRLLIAGRYAEAADSWEAAASLAPSFAIAFAMAARAALWAGDPGRAAGLLDRYDANHLYAPAQRATNNAIQAGIAALENPTGAGGEAFTAAHRTLVSLSLRIDAAMVALDAGMVLGPTPEVRPLLDDARSLFDELDAVALRARLDSIENGERAQGSSGPRTRSPETADPAARPA